MHGTTRGEDIYAALMQVVDDLNLPLEKLLCIATDGANAMKCEKTALRGHIITKFQDLGLPLPKFVHCIIHQENLVAKSLKMEHVMSVIKPAVNFIRSKGLKHRQFRSFLESLEVAYEDVPYYSEVRWLSRGKMLERAYILREEIASFLEKKGKEMPELRDVKFVCDFAFFVNITLKLNGLNKELQGQQNLLTDMYHSVRNFTDNLGLWIAKVSDGDVSDFHHLSNCSTHATNDYKEQLQALKREFDARFLDFKSMWSDIVLLTNPRSIRPAEASRDIQPELISLRNNPALHHLFQPDSTLLDSYIGLSHNSYPNLINHGLRYLAMFGSIYVCESRFSMMKYIKTSAGQAHWGSLAWPVEDLLQ